MTTDETDVLAIPCEVFAIELRIVDGDVLSLPEGILRVDDGIVNLDVAGILERVIAILTIVADTDI